MVGAAINAGSLRRRRRDYSDVGEESKADRHPGYAPRLGSYLQIRPLVATAADRIEPTLGEDRVLRAVAHYGADQRGSAEFSERDGTLNCSPDGVDLDTYHGLTRGNGNPIAGYQFDKTRLTKASDGSLILARSSGAFGLVFMVLPAGGTQTSWLRFPPAGK
jgi:hypothetical protein